MRGKPTVGHKFDGTPRITPAHAGKTPALQLFLWNVSDHPRACGENNSILIKLKSNQGSPPRMRGKRFVVFVYKSHARITPAHAGKTIVYFSFQFPNKDHPRACGENEKKTATRISVKGSPPRMRGKPYCSNWNKS